MNPVKWFIPILAAIGLAITAPGWTHWMGQLGSSPAHIQFLAGLILPIVVLLMAASWLEPRGSS